MKKIIALVALAVVAIASMAQSSPGLQYGQVPTAGQWNSYFAAKVDYNVNGIPLSSGGTGATSAAGALRNIFGDPATSGYFMRGNGTVWTASAIQTSDVPTLNQNTTGTAGGITGGALGSLLYQSGSGATSFLSGNTTTTPQFFTSTGTGAAAQAPTLTGSTGSGNVVLATSPALTTPTISGATVSGTLSATGTVTGSAFSTYLASPPAIGGSAAAAGSFTTLTASSTVSGAGITALQASPGPIGSTAPNTGAFTTLSASSTVSGTGFSTYLASPPAIGGTAASTVKGTTVTASTQYNLTNLLVSATAPTIGSCGATPSPSISAPNGTAAFRVTVGGGPVAVCTINLPTATTGWNCYAQNLNALTNASAVKMSASSTTAVTLTQYSTTGSTTNFTGSDIVAVSCFAY